MISDNGAEQAIRRLCKPNAKGHKKVSSEIAKQFFNGGQGRKELIKLFIESGGTMTLAMLNNIFWGPSL